MTNEIALTPQKTSLFDASQFNHWLDVATKLSKTTMIPKAYIGKPMDILVSMEMGQTVGLSMMQALQSIAVINGIPAIYGDAPLAICQNHPNFEWIREEPIYKGDTVYGYRCTIKRRNNDPHVVEFTIDNAKKAGLWGKAGPWTQYSERMLQLRARGFALRNTFPDALKGIQIKEEIEDIHVIDVQSQKQTQSQRINSLLAKKGINNDETAHSAETLNHANHSIPVNIDGSILDSDSTLAPQVDETEIYNGLVSSGKSKDSPTVTQNENRSPSESQLEDIELLMSDKGLTKERKLKAFDHFGVCSANELTFEQANEMIRILHKME